MRRDLKVNTEGDGRSLRTYLSSVLTEVPAKGIRRAIQRGQITVDGERVSSDYRLATGQSISVHIQDKFNSRVDLADVEVLFEDDHMAAIFKPEGIEVHGSKGHILAGALKDILSPSHQNDALLNPVVLHRLDKPTCGVLLIAKTQRSVKTLSQQFQTNCFT